MDRSQHTVTKYVNDENTHAVVIIKLLKKVVQVNNALYEVQLPKALVEHKKPIIDGCFSLQYAKIGKIESLLQHFH